MLRDENESAQGASKQISASCMKCVRKTALRGATDIAAILCT